MQFGARRIAREIGAAFAVLAMYALLLLAPWHQSNALQHDLAKLGYATLATVDLCAPVNPDGDTEHDPDAFKCHVAGVGKFDLAVLEPAAIAIPVPRTAQAVLFPAGNPGAHAAVAPHIGQARAPPVTV